MKLLINIYDVSFEHNFNDDSYINLEECLLN